MRKTTKILVLVVAMVTAVSLSFPAEVHAQHYYGHSYVHGSGHGFAYGSYGHGYSGYGPYGYGYPNDGSVRIEVSPKESRKEIQVYVDEGHAGVVNDFDGAFQRLYLPLGKHEVELRLDGFKTMRMAIFVSPGKTYHIRGQMEPLV